MGRDRIEERIGPFIGRLMRLALGKHRGSDGRERVQPAKRRALLKDVARARLGEFDRKDAQMFGQPRPPDQSDAVAWLHHGTALGGRTATHESEMPAMVPRQRLQYAAG